jgi:hypothetical protein
MKPLKCVTVLTGAGFLFGAFAFVGLTGVWAEPEYEPVEFQNNPKIKCVPRRINNQHRDLPRNQLNPVLQSQHHKGCAACHQSNRPVAGRGDRPRVDAATALLENSLNRSIQYDLKIGDGEWKPYELKPKTYHRHTWKYRGKKGKSPVYKIRYQDNGQDLEKDLLLVATPNKQLGNLYYFAENRNTNQLDLKTPKKKMYRKRKR